MTSSFSKIGYSVDRDSDMIALDYKGIPLKYDGTTDCTEFFEMFDAYCEKHRLGGVVSRDNFDEPLRPDDSIMRIANGIPNDRDHGYVTNFNRYNSDFTSKCQEVLALLKGSLSPAILMRLQGDHHQAYRTANRANLEVLRAAIIQRHGGWTDAKGQANFQRIKNLPHIISIATCDSTMYQLQMNINVRAGWNNAEELLRPSFYRSWLVEKISKWDKLATIYNAMQLDERITFDDGKAMLLGLVDKMRETAALAKVEAEEFGKSTAKPNLNQDFSISANQVTLSMDDYLALQAGVHMPAVDYQFKHRRLNENVREQEGRCYNCGQPGHLAKWCSVRKDQQLSRSGKHYPKQQQQILQPTQLQQQMFQKFLQQQQQGMGQTVQTGQRKRPFQEEFKRRPGLPSATTRGPFPPVGTGTKMIGAASEMEGEDSQNHTSDYQQFDDFMGAAASIEDNDDYDPITYGAARYESETD